MKEKEEPRPSKHRTLEPEGKRSRMEDKRKKLHSIVDDIKNELFLEYITRFVELAKERWDHESVSGMMEGGVRNG